MAYFNVLMKPEVLELYRKRKTILKCQLGYNMKLNNFFNDLDESIMDPVHKDLSRDLWYKNKTLKDDVKKFILEHLGEWLSLYTDKQPKNIFIAGSMTGFQYTEYSDIDVNVIIDLSDEKIKELTAFLPNGKNLPGTQHPINYYITNRFQLENAGPIYDVLKNKWIKKAEKRHINIHYKAVLEITLSWMRKIDLDVNELKRDVLEYRLYKHYLEQQNLEVDIDEVEQYLHTKENEIKADIDAIHITLHMIKRFRKEPFTEPDFKSDFLSQVSAVNANYTINNLVYKTLERFNYLDKLHEYAGMDFDDALKIKMN